MKYIVNYSNDTVFNIVLEEYAFKHLLDEDEIFLLWINKPSIIIGRHQNTIEEINRDYVREHDIEVVRRISGGGAVYHDLNNLNYTIISKENEDRAFDFKSFSTPVINTLAKENITLNYITYVAAQGNEVFVRNILAVNAYLPFVRQYQPVNHLQHSSFTRARSPILPLAYNFCGEFFTAKIGRAHV